MLRKHGHLVIGVRVGHNGERVPFLSRGGTASSPPGWFVSHQKHNKRIHALIGNGVRAAEVREQVTELLKGRNWARPGTVYDQLVHFAGSGTVAKTMADGYASGAPWPPLQALLQRTKDDKGRTLWSVHAPARGGEESPKGNGGGKAGGKAGKGAGGKPGAAGGAPGGKGGGGGKATGGGKEGKSKPDDATGAKKDVPPTVDPAGARRAAVAAEQWSRLNLFPEHWVATGYAGDDNGMSDDGTRNATAVVTTKLLQMLHTTPTAPSIAIAPTAAEFDEAVAAARSSESKVPRAVIGPVSRPGADQISFLAYSSLEKGKAGEGSAEPKPRRFLGYLLQVAPADVPPIQQKGDDAEEPLQEEVQRLVIEVDERVATPIIWRSVTEEAADLPSFYALMFGDALQVKETLSTRVVNIKGGGCAWQAEVLVPAKPRQGSVPGYATVYGGSGRAWGRGVFVRTFLSERLLDAEQFDAACMGVVWVHIAKLASATAALARAQELLELLPSERRAGVVRSGDGFGVRFYRAAAESGGEEEAEDDGLAEILRDAVQTAATDVPREESSGCDAASAAAGGPAAPRTYHADGFPLASTPEQVVHAFAREGWNVIASSPQRKRDD